MLSKMFKPLTVFCLLAVFCVSSMLSTEAWQSGKKCDKTFNARWDPYSCAAYTSDGETICNDKSVEFKADPGDCVGDYTGWECDRNGPTEVHDVGTVDCYWKVAKPPKKSVCAGGDIPDEADVAACRHRQES